MSEVLIDVWFYGLMALCAVGFVIFPLMILDDYRKARRRRADTEPTGRPDKTSAPA